jgi:hypothetical protein
MAKYWKSKTILAKIEAIYGTDPTPTGAANAILAEDVTYTPMDGEWVKRNVERPYFGAKPGVGTGFRSTLTFSVPMVGSGSLGVAPGWAPLIRACRAAQVVTAGVKVEYAPITDAPESCTLYFDIDGTKHVMLGTRGTWVLKLDASGIPMITFTLTSLFTVPVEAAKPTPDYSQFVDPEVASKSNTPTFTIGGTPFILRNFELDLGNDVQPRMLVGQESIIIADGEESLKVQVEAVPLTTYDPFTVCKAGTKQAIALAHGTVIGRKTRIDLPSCQQQMPTYQEQQGILEWPLTFTPLPTTGNDQWKITLT